LWELTGVQPLEPPDYYHLQAAIGWLELGNPREATAELELINPRHRHHPAVLDARWEIHAAAKNWDACLDVARTEIEHAPDRVDGWVHRAYALRRATHGTLEAAFEALRPAVEKFPELPLIPYNLACYCCQLGQLTEAREWLAQAFARAEPLGEKQGLRAIALQDSDLEALWPELRAK